MCDQRIKNNPQDKNAYFARGYAKGMHAAFIDAGGPLVCGVGAAGVAVAERFANRC